MGERAVYDAPDYKPDVFSDSMKTILNTEFSEQFVDAMKRRMIVSHFKYGFVAENVPERVDVLASLEHRLQRYKETGNSEWLVDAANFAMIEFMHPRHPEAHFRATAAHESPGRVRTDGGDPHGHGRPPDTAVERLREKFGKGE